VNAKELRRMRDSVIRRWGDDETLFKNGDTSHFLRKGIGNKDSSYKERIGRTIWTYLFE
jgi:hypothetical protein